MTSYSSSSIERGNLTFVAVQTIRAGPRRRTGSCPRCLTWRSSPSRVSDAVLNEAVRVGAGGWGSRVTRACCRPRRARQRGVAPHCVGPQRGAGRRAGGAAHLPPRAAAEALRRPVHDHTTAVSARLPVYRSPLTDDPACHLIHPLPPPFADTPCEWTARYWVLIATGTYISSIK